MSQFMDDYDYLIKIILIGDSCVGKSCLLVRYADDKFPEQYTSTIGVDFRFKSEKYDDKCVKVKIWDTAGQERYRSMARTYYRNAEGVIIVYDLTNKETFDDIKKWVSEARANMEDYEQVPKVVIGNKCDLVKERTVSEEEIRAKEKEFGIKFILGSAKIGEGVAEAFNGVIVEVIKRIQLNILRNEKENGVIVDNSEKKTNGNRCCG